MREPTLPMSRSALDRLGERFNNADQIAENDLEKLAQVVDVHQEVLDDLKDELADLGYPATTRVKTTATLIEKLRREGKMLLSRVPWPAEKPQVMTPQTRPWPTSSG